jgi:hypothetical protein
LADAAPRLDGNSSRRDHDGAQVGAEIGDLQRAAQRLQPGEAVEYRRQPGLVAGTPLAEIEGAARSVTAE